MVEIMRKYQINICINKSFIAKSKAILNGEIITDSEECKIIKRFYFKANNLIQAKSKATRESNKIEELLQWLNEDNIKYDYPLETSMNWNAWQPDSRTVEKYGNEFLTTIDKGVCYVFRVSPENFKTNTYASLHLLWAA